MLDGGGGEGAWLFGIVGVGVGGMVSVGASMQLFVVVLLLEGAVLLLLGVVVIVLLLLFAIGEVAFSDRVMLLWVVL